jgi:CBS domain-containing protein
MLALRDIMTREIATLSPEDTLGDAIAMLSERYITGAPVVSGEEVVGVISAMDIIDYASTARNVMVTNEAEPWEGVGPGPSSSYFTDPWDEPESQLEAGDEFHDALQDHTVDEAMTRGLLLLPPRTEVHVAAAFMIEHGVHRLLVVEDGRLEGLVTTTDFLRLIADRRL